MTGVNKRLVLDGAKKLSIQTELIPQAPKRGIVLKLQFAGVCHSDVHFYKQIFPCPCPTVLGHEMSGLVYAIGSEANTDLKLGEQVVLWPWGYCRTCRYCTAMTGTCSKGGRLSSEIHVRETYGAYTDGGFQNYVVVDSPEMLVPVPDDIPLDMASLIPCSGITAYNAVLKLKPAVDEAIKMKGHAMVGVVGAGGVALWAIQFIKAVLPHNVKVAAVDVLEHKCQDAKEAGADIAHCWERDGPATTAADSLISAAGGRFDGLIDFTGHQSALEREFYSLDQQGTLVLVGMGSQKIPAVPVNLFLLRGIKFISSFVGTLDQVKTVMSLVEERKVRPPPITHITLDDVEKTLLKLDSGEQRGRVVVKMVD